ncbi:unnamed protein product [Hymenolepis diminuta]|uniref:SHSP domain-containing protein n=2 Tax=Hymenolepis diminuta TaxID=6216 RepID=A0A0R3SER1_HYMDI|nr:unnamed protein product [Hymenolepis diminuta]
MSIYRTEMSVPIRVDTGVSRQPTVIPIITDKGYSTLGGKSTSSTSWFDKSHDDFFGKFDDPLMGTRHSDSERWFEDMRRRFDERRKQWDAEMREMRSSFFNTPTFSPSKSDPLSSISSRRYTPPSSSSEDCSVVTSYERGVDESLHFLAQFDVQPFHQEDVHVTIRDGQIVVTAVRERRIGTSSTSKQVTRTVDLPKGAQETLISASISADNILLVDVPIGSTSHGLSSYNTISGSSGTNSLTTPSTISGTTGRGSHLSSPTPSYIITKAKPKFHVEIPVGSDYQPDEIQIRTLNNRIYVSARHEEKLSNRSTFREFSKEYDIPEHIDPKSISARLEYGILHLKGTSLS